MSKATTDIKGQYVAKATTPHKVAFVPPATTQLEVLQGILRELKLIRAVIQGTPVTRMTDDELERSLTGILGVGPEEAFNK